MLQWLWEVSRKGFANFKMHKRGLTDSNVLQSTVVTDSCYNNKLHAHVPTSYQDDQLENKEEFFLPFDLPSMTCS